MVQKSLVIVRSFKNSIGVYVFFVPIPYMQPIGSLSTCHPPRTYISIEIANCCYGILAACFTSLIFFSSASLEGFTEYVLVGFSKVITGRK